MSLIPVYLVDPQKLQPAQSNRLYAANDTEIIVSGVISLPVVIDQHRYPATFAASENVDEVILGRDWLSANCVVWDFKTNKVTANGKPVHLSKRKASQPQPRCKRCRVGIDAEIPPRSEAIIPANVIFGNMKLPAGDNQWATTPCEPITGLRVARTLIPNGSPVAAVRVCNTSNRPIKVYKGQSVSTLHGVAVLPTSPQRPADEKFAKQQRDALVENVDPSVPPEISQQLTSLLDDYNDVFSYSEYDLGHTDVVQHEIHTGESRPFKQPLRPQPRARLPVVDNLINEMQSQGIIEPCQSEWASNIVLVTKKDGSIRFCVDYRKLNSLTQKDVYPLPRIETCLDTLSGAAWYSTFDLRSGFHQVKVHPRDANKTTFTCHRGTYRFPRMPFGLCNAPATFQRLMDTVLMGLNFDVCLAYLDDIIVYSSDLTSHLERLKKLFQRLREANLKLKPSKCCMLQKRFLFWAIPLVKLVSPPTLRKSKPYETGLRRPI